MASPLGLPFFTMKKPAIPGEAGGNFCFLLLGDNFEDRAFAITAHS
jgi:hypothetical protein